MFELVFIHGWGFDASVWDGLAEQLKEFPQQRVDMGFFGSPRQIQGNKYRKILIGHSLGFMHGLRQRQDWIGWVSINSFCRFTPDCVPVAALRDMQRKLATNVEETLDSFYGFIRGGANEVPALTPDINKLREGLDELRDGNLSETLKTIQAKGLVLASLNDLLVPKTATEALLDASGGQARIGWHDTAGHLLPLRDAAWCAEKIRKFLQNQ
jgi:pimeloyl-[acyl-carrier protein] methyl ester esterase